MFLRITVSCKCGCSFEVDNTREHQHIVCPNCSESPAFSGAIINSLTEFGKIPCNDHFQPKTYKISISTDDFTVS